METSRTVTFSVFMQSRTVDPTYDRVFTRQLRAIVMFFSTFLKLSFTHREKRNLLRLRDCFQRENADETFRTPTILLKGVKTVKSLLCHAFKLVSWRMGSKTSRKSEIKCVHEQYSSFNLYMGLNMFEKLLQWAFSSSFYLVCVFSIRKSTFHAFLDTL